MLTSSISICNVYHSSVHICMHTNSTIASPDCFSLLSEEQSVIAEICAGLSLPSTCPTSISHTHQSSKSPTPSAGIPLTATVGEQLDTNYQVFELPSESSDGTSDHQRPTSCAEILVNTALLTRTEALEAENRRLKDQLRESTARHHCFRYYCLTHLPCLVQ